MKTFRIVLEDTHGNKARISIKANTLQEAIDKVKGYGPESKLKVYGEDDEEKGVNENET